jgi:hypothetical protein
MEKSDLTRVCAWCQRLLKPDNSAGEPYVPKPTDQVTHGMCKKCHAEVTGQTESFALWLHTRERI